MLARSCYHSLFFALNRDAICHVDVSFAAGLARVVDGRGTGLDLGQPLPSARNRGDVDLCVGANRKKVLLVTRVPEL
jgi:hypothetical protein